MSRVGQKPINVPSEVNLEIAGSTVKVSGKNGALSYEVSPEVTLERKENELHVTPKDKSKKARMLWGTTRNRLSNMVEGVHNGFTVNLEINGVGYRAAMKGADLSLQLGFSHDVTYPIPEGIKVACAKPTSISITGADKQLVGQVAAEIRNYRRPEPFKGKGIKYENETIFRKEGKKK